VNRFAIALVTLLFTSAVSSAQNSSSAGQTPPVVVGHGSFPVKIAKTLDSSKLKEDDVVETETAGSFKLADDTLVPKGSKLLGRVVSAKARSKGDADSRLNLVFNSLNISGGKTLQLKGIVQAVYPPAEESMGPNMATMGTSAGGATRNAGSAGEGITNAQSGSNLESSSKPQAAMDVKATGVQGLQDLQLENGVLTSKRKNVKLTRGVRMVVQSEIYQ